MRFKSHNERMMHPQARLIPESLWNNYDFFLNTLPDALVPIMQADDSAIESLLQGASYGRKSEKERRLAWVAVALSHAQLSVEALVAISGSLNMSDALVFKAASAVGRLDVLRYLEEKAPDRLAEMIGAGSYWAFRLAAENGHLDVLRYLEEKAPGRLAAMIEADSYWAFRYAAENGHLDVLRYLEEKAPGRLAAMIGADSYWAFRLAAKNGHLEVLRYLEEKAPGRLAEMIGADSYQTFRLAAKNGHLEVLRYLEEKAPDRLAEMIEADSYWAFRNAAQNGHLDVLRYLEEKAPGRLAEMIGVYSYWAFRLAAENGHLDVLRYLEEKAPDRLAAMIGGYSYHAFRVAAQNGHLETIDYLLSHATAFAYAEQHTREHSNHVNPFVTEKLAALRAQKDALEDTEPTAVFDIADANEARLLFYVLRNLIRRNELGLRDDIAFLLNIPSVRALIHTAVTHGTPNELLRLALTIGNQDAAGLLLNIPAVRQLAEQNDFYRNDALGGFDLRALAQNRESSMTALSTGESARLQDAIERYQPMIKAAGVSNIMDDLRKTLASRYEAHPAVLLMDENNSIVLPLHWKEFQDLNLNADMLEKAMKAYATNIDHTAWRYLSKPNPWMHEQASYVAVNPDNHAERWSTFEEYQPEICMYYLGVIDAESPPIDGYTLDTRLDGFINELAHIGRAHNWDNTRIKMNGDEPLLDDNNEPIMEEYDDLEKDRPSCFSGVKRRLFQSARGHALFIMLTKEVIAAEIAEFVRKHFKASVNKDNRDAIQQAWSKNIDGDDMEAKDWVALKSLDISPEKQREFIASLGVKYGRQFTLEPAFTKQINDRFILTKAEDAHVFNFGDLHPETLFEVDASEEKPRAEGGATFFQKPPTSKPEDNEAPSSDPTGKP